MGFRLFISALGEGYEHFEDLLVAPSVYGVVSVRRFLGGIFWPVFRKCKHHPFEDATMLTDPF